MFFKERKINFYFVDLNERSLSPGELDKIIQKVGLQNIIDTQSKNYKEKGYSYRDYDPREEVMDDNSLLLTPIIRFDGEVVLGYAPDDWKRILN